MNEKIVCCCHQANVGVGINSGKEGMAAVLASDVALPRFSMLSRLLLLHGSQTYTRLSKLVLYSFAKNMALALPQFWFAMVCGFSGQMMYFDFLFTLYNAVFATGPIMVVAFTDEHASQKALLKYPVLYVCNSNSCQFVLLS
jgi:phospholipid-transporting ATPase